MFDSSTINFPYNNSLKYVYISLYTKPSLYVFRWEELHALASEPTESHVFLAEHFHDGVNGLYTTLSTFSFCNATPAGWTFH